MKYLFTILILLSLSCSKNADDNKVCWNCELSQSPNGQPNPDRRVCLPEGEEPGTFQDNNGNDLSSYCTKE